MDRHESIEYAADKLNELLGHYILSPDRDTNQERIGQILILLETIRFQVMVPITHSQSR